MNHSSQRDLIGFADVVAKLPSLLRKAPHLARGLQQAYLRRPNTPTGLGVAFEQAVIRNPHGNALLFETQKFTYLQLNAWANQIAHYYLTLGARKGDVIAVMLENRPELIATIIALAKIGVTIALVNTSQVAKALVHSINLVKPIALIVGEECRPNIDATRDQLELSADRMYWFADTATLTDVGEAPLGYQNLAAVLQQHPSFNPATTHSVTGKDGLFYIYTSGTTGLPKAVIFKHSRWMLAYGTYGHILDLHEDDVMYVTLPLYHATGVVVCWCGVIAGGGALAIRRKYSTSSFWKDVKYFNASAIGYVGEMCRYLMDAPASELDHSHRVTKMIGNGVRPNIWDKFKSRFGIQEVLELYGSSEGNVAFSNIFNFDNTVGFSPTPYAVIAFDKDKNEPIRNAKGHCIAVKKGDVGLLVGKITRRSPFDGYSDPSKTQAVTIVDVFKKGDAYFNTGDLVRDLGFRHAQFIDRLGDTFRWKGENVSTHEVENIVSDFEKFASAVAYGVEIPHTNGRAGMVAVTLAPEQGFSSTDAQTLVSTLKQQLPHYAIPVFLRIQAQVQTTSTFKYQKTSLKDQGYNLAQLQDEIWVLLPSATSYCRLTAEIMQNIQDYKYRF